MILITPTIHIDPAEVKEAFIRASGPGGQKVNKTESAVQLRFDARRSKALPHAVFLRLKALAGRRMTADGVVVITAREFRTQEANRRAALDRLIALIRSAVAPPKHRRKTKPTKASKQRRLEAKKRVGGLKKSRGRVTDVS